MQQSVNIAQRNHRFICNMLWPFRWHVAGLLFLVVYFGLDTSISSYLLKAMLDSMSQAKVTGVWTSAIVVMTLYLTAGGLIAIAARFNDWVFALLKTGVESSIANFLTSHLMQHSHQFYQENVAGTLISKLNSVAESVPDLIEMVLRCLSRVLAIVAGVITLWLFMPSLAWVMGIWAIGFIIMAGLIARRIHVLSESVSGSRAAAIGEIADTITNVLSVRLFSASCYESSRVSQAFDRWTSDFQCREWFLVKCHTLLRIWWLLRNIMSVWIAAYLFAHDKITVGDVALSISMSVNFTLILRDLIQELSRGMRLYGNVTQGLNTLLVPHGLVDAEEAQQLAVKKGQIVFHNVSFSYRPGRPLFSKLSIIIESGERVGLVGYSGAGKTTFVNILLRLYDIQAGAILIDGNNIAETTQTSLHDNIAFIPQEPSLFHRTIMENIRYGNQRASDQDVIEAARCAHADEFIRLIPEGYQALVGDRGIKLSGGQRQRIAIARAFLKQGSILVMDEATSALDSITEQYIQASLVALMSNRTTIVIAHRLATLLSMDRILLFDNGVIVEDGIHHELLERNGLYAAMWHAQSCGFLPEQRASSGAYARRSPAYDRTITRALRR